MIAKSLQDFALEPYVNTLCKNLSGGNKRKLCTAIALLGKPKLVLMDEPTSGMDVVTRKEVWKSIKEAVASGCSVLLTSEALEECEELCSRIAIMTNGEIKCVGTPEDIKRKFGQGLLVKMTVKSSSDIQRCLNFIDQAFGVNARVEIHCKTIHVNICGSHSAGAVYNLILSKQHLIGLVDLSVSPTSLEEVR